MEGSGQRFYEIQGGGTIKVDNSKICNITIKKRKLKGKGIIVSRETYEKIRDSETPRGNITNLLRGEDYTGGGKTYFAALVGEKSRPVVVGPIIYPGGDEAIEGLLLKDIEAEGVNLSDSNPNLEALAKELE